MPVRTGLDVARAIGERTHVVFVTAYDEYAVAAFEEGAVDYVLKPVTAERLTKVVARLKARLAAPPICGVNAPRASVYRALLDASAGGATSFPKVNGVTQASKSQFALDAGGGLLFVIRKGIVFRFDVRNYTLFTANSTDNRQEYSGGLAVFF